MSNSIILYHRKQPVIIHTSDEGEMWVTELDSHNKKDMLKTLSKILNKPHKTIQLSIKGLTGKAIYNDGCRYIDFSLGYLNKQ